MLFPESRVIANAVLVSKHVHSAMEFPRNDFQVVEIVVSLVLVLVMNDVARKNLDSRCPHDIPRSRHVAIPPSERALGGVHDDTA